MVSDSEVDEMSNLFTGVNLYEMAPGGNLLNTFSTTNIKRTGFSNEPTGLAHNDLNGHWYISDDDQLRVFEINLGPDRTYGTSDDIITSFNTSAFGSNDDEGVAFDSQHQMLFVADGLNLEVYKLTPGPDGVFNGVPPAGDDVMTHFDTSVFGMTDLEGIEYNPATQTLYLTGGYSSSAVYESTTDGTLVRIIDVSQAEPILKAPAGLAYGPGSGGPNTRSLYLSARGVDNNTNANENDGEVFEFSLPGPVIISFSPTSGGASTPVTISGKGFTGATSVKFNGTSATFTVSSDTQVNTTVPSSATTGPISVTAPGGPTVASTSNFTVTSGSSSVSLSPTSLDFGSQVVNTTSAAKKLSLTNSGSSTLNISTVSITGTNSGDFAQTNTCGASVAAGASCTISVTFTPTATGTRSASLSITDNASPSTQTISLSGTGVLAAPVVKVLDPNALPAGTARAPVKVLGMNFTPGASVSFSGPGRSPTVDGLVFVNSTEIDVTVTTYSNGPKRNRLYDVTVTNPDGSSGRCYLLTVRYGRVKKS